MQLVAVAATDKTGRGAAADLVERDRRAHAHAACYRRGACQRIDAAAVLGVHAHTGDIAVQTGVLQLCGGVGSDDVGGDAATHRHAAGTGAGYGGGADQIARPCLDRQSARIVQLRTANACSGIATDDVDAAGRPYRDAAGTGQRAGQ